ncbi:MAG: TIR domain-containing protein, partial [Cyanobacteria bacterium P01_D01_bin.71]
MPPKQSKDKQALIERRRLYRTLQALPAAHFDEIVFALNPPSGLVSPMQSSQGTRTGELLGWAQGPGGCGLDDVYDLLEEYIPDFERPQLTTEQPAALENSRIFISYKRDIYPDEQIAMGLHQELSKIFNVQIDQSMLIGTKWQAWIDEQLQQADFLIVLLSAASVRSEMVMRELQKACKLAHKQGRPKILPVRLAYRTPFEYPLSEYLNEINWAFWQDETDTPQLINDLQKAIQGEELPINTHALKDELLAPEVPEPMQPPTPMAQPLELPEGTMDGGSQFYVARSSDAIAIDTIQQQGVTITIKGPRQMGKSSLLIRVMNQARSLGKKVVFL